MTLKNQNDSTVDDDMFKKTSHIAYILRNPKLRALYDSILLDDYHHQQVYWKGFYYYYTRHKLACMIIIALLSLTMLEYLKAWASYWTERAMMEQFIENAKIMAQRISDKHLSAKTHKSYMDFGTRTIQCEITKDREIVMMDSKGHRVPLDIDKIIEKPGLYSISIIRALSYTVQSLQNIKKRI